MGQPEGGAGMDKCMYVCTGVMSVCNLPSLLLPFLSSLSLSPFLLQIDSLIQGVTDTIPPSSPSPSPSTLSPAKRDRAELVSWLKAETLLSCASPLEVNGFDNLRFLGGGVLAMDDLPDIGITSVEDQL